MSKINIEMCLKSSEEVYKYKGKGLKRNNKLIFNDNNVKTIITLDKTIYLERIHDYSIKLGFCINKKIHTTYNTQEGIFNIYTDTNYIKTKENTINIRYKEYINKIFIDEFELFLKFGIDTIK